MVAGVDRIGATETAGPRAPAVEQMSFGGEGGSRRHTSTGVELSSSSPCSRQRRAQPRDAEFALRDAARTEVNPAKERISGAYRVSSRFGSRKRSSWRAPATSMAPRPCVRPRARPALGIYRVNLVYRPSRGVHQVRVQACEALMTLQLRFGLDTFMNASAWRQTGNGWVLTLPGE